MRIAMFLNASFPPDIRVEKEADALISNGIEVHLICAKKVGESPYEVINGVCVHRIDSPALDQKKKMAFWDVVSSVNFIHPKFYKQGLKIVKSIQADAIHIHDLPLAKTGVKIGKKVKLPVVLDLHENYPEALKTWFKWRTSPIVKFKNALFFSYKRWLNYEASIVKKADHIIAVVAEMKERLISLHGLPKSKVDVVSNMEPKSFIDENQLNSELLDKYKEKFVISYVGGLGPHRGIDVMLEGTQYLKDKIPKLLVLIVGSGSVAVVDNLKNIVKKHGLDDVVEFTGHQPKKLVYSYMKLSAINVVPHHSTTHTDNTIPHKLFQIMMTKRPLLVSSSKPLKRVATETNAGLVFRAGDDKDFANKVLELYNNPDKVVELGNNGFDSTLNGDLNWETEGGKLVAFYKRILS